MSEPELVVVVVTYNSHTPLQGLLDSMEKGMQGVEKWRLIVADNDSSDGTLDFVRKVAPDATVIEMGRNAGYAAAINAALSTVPDTSAVLILNPDVRLGAGMAAKLLVAMGDPRVGIAAPQLRSGDGSLAHSIRRDPSVGRVWAEALLGGRRAASLGLSEVVTNPDAYTHGRTADWVTGAVLAVAPSCRAAVGDWDETFFLYSEEVDYCQRVRAAGFTVRYVPEAIAEHASGAYGTNVDLWRILVANRVRHFERHHQPLPSTLFRIGLAVGEGLRSASQAHRAGLRAALRASGIDAHPGHAGSRPSARPGPSSKEPNGSPRQSVGSGVIWFAAQDWWYHNQAHSDFQLMKEVARTSPVLVVNSLGLRMPRRGTSSHAGRRILRKLRSFSKLVRRPIPGIPGFHVMTPIFLPVYGDTRLARANAWLVRQQVQAVATCIGIRRDRAIGITIPTAWPVARPMRRTALVFNRSDLHSAFPEANGPWIRSLEEQLLRHSDRVLYVSRELMRSDSGLVTDRAVFLDHGVDLEHFSLSDTTVAPEVEMIPHPRVGFFGGLDDYVVDLDLIGRMARSLPDCQVVLIGDATCNMDELTALPNVHWLGHRKYEEIPALGRGFDVAIMPWLDNEWIRFANPIKLKEYLALGLPVVSTEYPEVDRYRDAVLVADSPEEFSDLVQKALSAPGDPHERRAMVTEFSWRARSAFLATVINNVRGSQCVG